MLKAISNFGIFIFLSLIFSCGLNKPKTLLLLGENISCVDNNPSINFSSSDLMANETLFVDMSYSNVDRKRAAYFGFKNEKGSFWKYKYFNSKCELAAQFNLNDTLDRFSYQGNVLFVNYPDSSIFRCTYSNGLMVGDCITTSKKSDTLWLVSVDSITYLGTAVRFEKGIKRESGAMYKNYRMGEWKKFDKKGDYIESVFHESDYTIENNYFNIDSILQKDYKISKLIENEIFEFYSVEEFKKYGTDILDELKIYYDVMTSHLNHSPDHKIVVELYRYAKDVKRMSGIPSAHAAGVAIGAYKIKMISPRNNHTTSKHFKQMITHEFSHVILNNVIKSHYKLPHWVAEGLAEYESHGNAMSETMVKSGIRSGKIPTLVEISSNFYSNDWQTVRNSYRWSHTLVKFMIDKYGWRKFNDYIREPWRVRDIYGQNENGIWKVWLQEVKTKYS